MSAFHVQSDGEHGSAQSQLVPIRWLSLMVCVAPAAVAERLKFHVFLLGLSCHTPV